jgi:hypothetical protein
MQDLYDIFMTSHTYCYKAVNKYNVPYAMFRYQVYINLQFVFVCFIDR